MEIQHSGARLTRRRLLGVGAAALVAGACSDSTDDASPVTPGPRPTDTTRNTEPLATGPSAPAPASTSESTGDSSAAPATDVATPELAALTADDFAGLGSCVLLPEQMAGPFPLDQQFERRDVTEGLPGRPMRLGLRVVDQACVPIPGAAVEIWHCDASGDYSAFVDGGGGKDEGEGTTFLRGTQTAGDDGIVEFSSIVPGCYTGRAVHVHLRVRVAGGLALTSQLYFDPDHLAVVFAEAPYAEFGPPDTSNEADGIAGDPASDGTLLHTSDADTSAGPGTLALANLAVDPARAS